ncbi:cytochrome c1 heme lyase [Myriangium duriaei CBS 260.36]|uniref:Holocytochrome c-type synthase n=1 Tax=Myriangium duriaei CBS 260.36 TaxID=1168546 RepID=A0A9P4IZY4_9PEZI|nr:cytochrome c1 heme lyase [Myriangium duriaei CBS 260.36]
MAAKPPSGDAQACPVDHTTRQAWLDKARSQAPDQTAPSPPQNRDPSVLSRSHPPFPSSNATLHFSLDQSREVSTIPRFHDPSAPANSEHTAAASAGGTNWIYPSEQMFFDAMRRKSFSPDASDMKSIVPIHNAVNERAWAEIKAWETGRGSEKCGGPKLVSFSGDSKALTPKARMNGWLGYTAPFDRHDWVVDRCGTRVEYVIDFYSGRQDPNGKGGLNFYLDVRPKLNSFEGWKMRLGRVVGL